jgi:hypothetical protein
MTALVVIGAVWLVVAVVIAFVVARSIRLADQREQTAELDQPPGRTPLPAGLAPPAAPEPYQRIARHAAARHRRPGTAPVSSCVPDSERAGQRGVGTS